MRTGRAGGDWVYRINKGEVPLSTNENPRIWATFASPAKLYRLYFDSSTSSLYVKKGDEAIDSEQAIEIPSMSLEELNQIKNRFFEQIDDIEIREQLKSQTEHLQEYSDWLKQLRQLNPKLGHFWVEFRRTQIEAIFIQRVKGLQLSEEKEKALISNLNYCDSPESSVGANHSPKKTYPRSKSTHSDDDWIFRSAVIEVISRMSTHELRNLNLPAGLLIDATLKRNSISR